jgi:hypothetical protein
VTKHESVVRVNPDHSFRTDERARGSVRATRYKRAMDPKGAEHLRRAIEQQAHWRKAAGVQDGRQPLRDPDVSQLVEFVDAVRRYRSADGKQFEKLLLDGLWVEPPKSANQGG